MKITILKKSHNKEVINRVELADLAAAIKNGLIENAVRKTREIYHLINPHRLADGQISVNWKDGIVLPRICFAADFIHRNDQMQMLQYSGLVVLEVNNLPSYEKAVEVRELAKKLPETMLCFLGGSGKSVKIVCRGELFPKEDARRKKEGERLPKDEAEIRQFHLNLYNTARMAYQNQFEFRGMLLIKQRGEDGVEAYRLTGTCGASHKQVGHLGQVGDEGVVADGLAEGHR